MKHPDRGLAGFTLIELLVVVVILGVLMAIAIPSYFTAREAAKVNTANANARMIIGEVETIYVRMSGNSYAAASDPSNFGSGSAAVLDLGGAIPKNPCTGGAVYGTDYLVSHSSSPVSGVSITAAQGECSNAPTRYQLGTG